MFRRIVSGVTLGAAVCAIGALTDGCLTRPVEATSPVTKTNFITSIPQGSIDKVDILFDIDNSASMGDKQAYLSEAVPDLITRLVTPNCLDDTDGVTIRGQAGTDGKCQTPGSTAEFPPVHNLHIGLLSSSLGARLGNACPTATENPMQGTQPLANGMKLDRHNDDRAHLLDRAADPMNLTNYAESPLGAADPGGFLNWFPSVMANMGITPTGPTPITDATILKSDFQKLVVGVHQFGCGIESQLETWYRFLVQPDPYDKLKTQMVNGQTIAEWDGIDTTLLAQRAEFLRPDSLVAVLVLTDEDDSEVDVRSFGGSGYFFMSTKFNPPRGTSSCASDPGGSACTSCAFGTAPNDSECKKGFYTAPNDWGFDLNLRHVHEQQKYGADLQFPIQRYVLGLTSKTVPNRDGEYPPDTKHPGGYASKYQGGVNGSSENRNCTNPLYAAKLPKPSGNPDPNSDEICNLPVGPRSPGLVYYAHIGGIPHELLQVDPSNPDSPQKAKLSGDDWTRILGKDPLKYDYAGIDQHMIESYKSRSNAAQPANGFKVSDTPGGDKIAGNEWETDSMMPQHQGLTVDRQYACIFKLKEARQCDKAAVDADPTLADSCDCQPPKSGSGPTTFSPTQLPPVCNQQKQTEQLYAKTYPTIRELLLAKLLGDAPQANEGIISSLCPIHTEDQMGGNDPLYGYRPAINTIVDRLKSSLAHQCLPQKLSVEKNAEGVDQVSCLVLGTFPVGVNDCPTGYNEVEMSVLKHFRTDQHAAWMAGGKNGDDPSEQLTCQLTQGPANVPCDTNSEKPGWCYVQGAASKGCPQAILFTPGALSNGVVTSLQCIEASINLLDAAAASEPAPTGDN